MHGATALALRLDIKRRGEPVTLACPVAFITASWRRANVDASSESSARSDASRRPDGDFIRETLDFQMSSLTWIHAKRCRRSENLWRIVR
jgi:hypothetical protein